MFFALGVLVAGLLGLMILPALWRRAVRLSTRRVEMQTPLSMDEVLAERDLLRAEFAVCERKLETRLEQERDARTRDRAELGRKIAALSTQSETLAALKQDHARSEAMLAETQARAVDLQAQLGAALIEVYDGMVAREKFETLGLETRRAQRLANDRQLVLAGVETRLAGVEAQLRDAQREVAEREKLLTARQTVVERLTEERDRARAELARYSQAQMSLRSEIETRDRRVSQLGDELAELNRKLAFAERKLGSAILPADDAALRESISDLGSEVLRISQAIEARAQAPERPVRKRAGKGARAAVE
jgi:CII-binding regulator of phage lambda lysogenization HflD